jgi:hypothetical protein
MKLSLHWTAEAIGRGVDNNVGAALWQITSAAQISHNCYCEERYTSADGRYLVFARHAPWQEGAQLWIHETGTALVAKLCDGVQGFLTSNIHSNLLFFATQNAAGHRVLVRVNLSTLEQDEVLDLSPCPRARNSSATASPDGRFLVSNGYLADNRFGLFRVDLQRGTWEIFHEREEICNPHLQFEPSRGEEILVQWNRGSRVDAEQNVLCWGDAEGITLYAINRDGGDFRPLPVGRPYTGAITGHECWIGDSGEVLLTTHAECGEEIHIARPGAEKSRLLWSGLAFDHLSVSADGQYFVTDDMNNARLYLGNLKTGRMLPLCESGASFGTMPQHTHPHAYLTPDNKRVIFNSDRTGICQVWCADVPAGVLAALAEPLAASPLR